MVLKGISILLGNNGKMLITKNTLKFSKFLSNWQKQSVESMGSVTTIASDFNTAVQNCLNIVNSKCFGRDLLSLQQKSDKNHEIRQGNCRKQTMQRKLAGMRDQRLQVPVCVT